MVRLSEPNWHGKSLTAIAVAAHEVGHAMQHHQNDVRLNARTKLIPIVTLLGQLSAGVLTAVPIIGLLDATSRTDVDGRADWTVGIAVSRATAPGDSADGMGRQFCKALPVLKAGNYISPKQETIVRRVLRAAALTYFAAALADAFNLFLRPHCSFAASPGVCSSLFVTFHPLFS